MRRLPAAILLLLVLPAVAFAGITKGPYLMNPTATSMTIAWVTDDSAPGTVEYFAEENDVRTQDSIPAIYEIGDVRTVWHHHVTLYGLQRDRAYTYSIASGGDERGPFTFETAPPNTEPFHFVAYGDSRGGHGSVLNPAHVAVVAAAAQQAPAFFINSGDLISSGEDIEDWDAYFEEIAALGAESPMIPVYGNHEDGYDEDLDLSGADNWARFFPLPDDGRALMWYSFDYANIHFAVLNLTHEYTLWTEFAPQRIWLEADLEAAVGNPHTNFTVLVYHQPAFSWKPDRSPSFAASAVVAPMAAQYGVDLILAGHNHHYARAEITGVQHVTTGGGGAPLYDFYDDVEQRAGYRAHAMAYHYCLIETDSTSMNVTVYGVPGGEVLDQFTLNAHTDLVPEDDDTDDDDDSGDDDDSENPPGDDDDLPAEDDSSGGGDDGCG